MELVTKKRLVLVAGRANHDLAEEVAEVLGTRLDPVSMSEFANGELHCRFGDSIRGADVFIIGSHCSTGELSVNDAIMEQLIMVDAAKRASAKRISVVAPFYGYGRQDRRVASPSRRSWWPTSSRPPEPSGSSRWISTRARSRASSTARSTT